VLLVIIGSKNHMARKVEVEDTSPECYAPIVNYEPLQKKSSTTYGRSWSTVKTIVNSHRDLFTRRPSYAVRLDTSATDM
jgi:hypothetical protein